MMMDVMDNKVAVAQLGLAARGNHICACNSALAAPLLILIVTTSRRPASCTTNYAFFPSVPTHPLLDFTMFSRGSAKSVQVLAPVFVLQLLIGSLLASSLPGSAMRQNSAIMSGGSFDGNEM
jgi:hypothetical protein